MPLLRHLRPFIRLLTPREYLLTALVLTMAIRNRTAFRLADWIEMNPRAVDYMLGGGFEGALAAIIAALAWPWRLTLAGAGFMVTCGFIAFEGLQRPICRALTTDLSKVPKDANLCDWLIGLPISLWTGWMFLIAICVVIVVFNKNRGPQ